MMSINFNFPWPEGAFKNIPKSHKVIALQKLRTKLEAIDFMDEVKNFAKHLVFSDGNPDAKLMIIGEAPGEDEDLSGSPFVGRSGKLLRYFLEQLGWNNSNYYITNVLPWRPPENRAPTAQEIAMIKPYLIEHIKIIQPKLIIAVGSVALKALGIEENITKAQKQVFNNELGSIFAIYHPAYILRMQTKKKEFWMSLCKMTELIGGF